MNIEYELKFLDIQVDKVIKRIEAIGGRKLRDRHLLRRCIFYIPNGLKGSFIRVRDEGDRVTLTYKQSNGLSVNELEEEVESFEKTLELLKCMQLIYSSYQENYRESYLYEDATITFDTWPGLPTFIEVEALDENGLLKVTSLLELDAAQGIIGTVDEIYNKFGIDILKLPEITFQVIPVPKNTFREID